MTAVAVDTLKVARTLRDTAQMSQVQAEGIADALAEAMSGAELATRSDIVAVQADIVAVRADIAAVRADVARDLTVLETTLRADIGRCATKVELAELKATVAEVKADIGRCATKVELAEVKASIADARTDILRWVFAAIAGQTALIVTLLKVWH